MASVRAMGYLGICAPDLEAWATYAREVLGMEVHRPENEAERAIYLRMDERAWRFRVEEGEAKAGGLAFLGLEVVDEFALEELVRTLEHNGVAVKEDRELAKARRVNGLVRVTDPGGVKVELFHGARVAKGHFVSPTGARFITGRLGFGHIVTAYDEYEEAKHFYMDLLGFRLTDTDASGDAMVFTRVNGRHHSIGIARAGFWGTPPGLSLGHFMVEVVELDMVGHALDKVMDGVAPLACSLGRHGNDNMMSFNSYAPSGLQVEFGWGGQLIDDATHLTGNYETAYLWGRKR